MLLIFYQSEKDPSIESNIQMSELPYSLVIFLNEPI